MSENLENSLWFIFIALFAVIPSQITMISHRIYYMINKFLTVVISLALSIECQKGILMFLIIYFWKDYQRSRNLFWKTTRIFFVCQMGGIVLYWDLKNSEKVFSIINSRLKIF